MEDEMDGSVYTPSDGSPTEDVSHDARKARLKGTANPFLLPTFLASVDDGEKEEKKSAEASYTAKTSRFAGPITLKKVAHAIMQQQKLSKLLKNMHQPEDQPHGDGFVTKHSTNEKKGLSFNVNAFKAHVQSCGTLPTEVKNVLKKLSYNRSVEEVDMVLQIVKRMKGFQRYPMYVKRELAKVLYYDVYEQDRVIIKQGHIGVSFYFIVSGSVVVQRVEEDRTTGEKHNQIISEMTGGDSFGELALMHDIRRTATIICKERSEFLRVDKDDFNEVLIMSHQIEYERKLAMLNAQPLLKDWSQIDIKQTVTHTKLREYPANTIILGGMKRRSAGYIYLIGRGKCKVVREVEIYRQPLASGKFRHTLPPIGRRRDTINPSRIETKLLTVRILNPGEYFGVGEDLTKTYIIATGRVHCILVHHMMFNKRGERGRFLGNMREQLEQTFPSPEQAFTSYLEDTTWKLYKKHCIDDVLRRLKKKPRVATFDDVPLVLRRENSYYNNK